MLAFNIGVPACSFAACRVCASPFPSPSPPWLDDVPVLCTAERLTLAWVFLFCARCSGRAPGLRRCACVEASLCNCITILFRRCVRAMRVASHTHVCAYLRTQAHIRSFPIDQLLISASPHVPLAVDRVCVCVCRRMRRLSRPMRARTFGLIDGGKTAEHNETVHTRRVGRQDKR